MLDGSFEIRIEDNFMLHKKGYHNFFEASLGFAVKIQKLKSSTSVFSFASKTIRNITSGYTNIEVPTVVLAKGTNIPNENIPNNGPLAIPPKLIDKGTMFPKCSTIKTIAVENTPRTTTMLFIILLAVFSVVFFGITGLIKSS